MDPLRVDPASIARSLRGQLGTAAVIDRADPRFDSARRVWNGTADRRPAAIVRAATTDDVVATVRFAHEQSVLLAVRGGGHSLPGLSTCDDGIVLDLSALADAVVDDAGRRVRVGGGARLGDLDRTTVPMDLVVPAGVVSHTGVGGLTLGGGMGWLSRRFGLTIDHLLGVDLVLADGRQVTVDERTTPDLFWAIRGGGGNFGVVTEFRFRPVRLGPVRVGTWTYAAAEAPGILARFRDLAASAPRDVTSSFIVTGDALRITAIASGGHPRAEDLVAAFGRLAVPIDSSLDGLDFLGLQSRGDEHVRWGRRYYAKGGFLGALDDTAIDTIVDVLREPPSPDAEIYVIQLGGAITDHLDAETAYTGRAAEFYWIVQPIWDDADDDERCLRWGRSGARRMASLSMAGNYVNEQADADPSVARDAYGADTHRRLAEIKRTYDPGNLFRLNQNIVPATVDPSLDRH